MDKSNGAGPELWQGSSSSPVSTPPKSPLEQDCIALSPQDEGASSSQKMKKEAINSAAPVKRPRKKKDDVTVVNDSAMRSNTSSIKERKPRKTRETLKQPLRKKQRLSEDATTADLTQSQQRAFGVNTLELTQGNGLQHDPKMLSQSGDQDKATASQHLSEAQAKQPFQIGVHEPEPKSYPQSTTPPPIEHAKSLARLASGQRFDPIRSASAENAANLLHTQPRLPILQSQPQARSPLAIASLIDGVSPPPATAPKPNIAIPAPSLLVQDSNHNGPITVIARQSTPASEITPPVAADTGTLVNSHHLLIQSPLTEASGASRLAKGDPNHEAPSPKPVRQKQAPPPLPLGSGLLSSAAFGKSEPVQHESAEVPNQCIVIEVPMKQENGNYVNFMKEVEAKYGFDIAHPRLAEHRRRMAQIAAAGAALESGNGSADEMPIDDSDGDSNVDIGGADEDSTAGEGKRKRRTRANAYDKTDDFIDDTELMWEEQALASQDGYFVWSGPLVAEPEKSMTERLDGSTTKRGRGRGRGGSTRGDSAGRGGRVPGGGRGSRGGTTVRKPRVTKAERARMEQEKEERAKMASAVTRPSLYPSVTA